MSQAPIENPLPTRYDPSGVESRWYARWVERGYFHSEPRADRKPYTIVIPPPNVTGALHMGHALNNTLQDILIRFRRMQGWETLWVPGTDHAGIATQNVVERALLKSEKKTRHDLGRAGLLERIWAWKAKYGERILGQLRKLGCSCDWDRTRFTLDEGLSRAVREVFVRLFRKGLIYRGRYLVNWCPKLRTALSDDEVDPIEVKGHLWHIRYPVKDAPGRSITVATTRPETMLGDTAVAVHPEDERYRDLVGKMLILPLLERLIPVIADSRVERGFGTGAVKVTPAHDPTDFEIGERHSLEKINILEEDGRINAAGGPYAGLDRFAARAKVVEDLTARGLLERVEDHVHTVGHCSRTGDVIEPYLSLQWFVRMRPLAEKALEATRTGRVRFHPERWTAVYYQWLESVRDWCVSRQLWWGHQIPIWYAPDGTPYCGHDEAEVRVEAERVHGPGVELQRDPDVLDTWFSSALWPFSTLGWPDDTPELRYYYPTNTLVTARDIIFFWVARMVMMGEEVMGREPFGHVYIHGTILDREGQRMSKSRGNGIDPVAMIEGGVDENTQVRYEPHGADGVRFSLATLSTEGQDLKLWPERFEDGQRFITKLWNAARFVLGHLGEKEASVASSGLQPGTLCLEDRWMLSRLREAIEETTAGLEDFRYCDAAARVRSSVWDDFCDWYLEAAKTRFAEGADPAQADAARSVLAYALDVLLRLLHPICPFVTEELWHHLGAVLATRPVPFTEGVPAAESITLAPWPTIEGLSEYPEERRCFETIQAIVRLVRKIRQERGLAPQATSRALVGIQAEGLARDVARETRLILALGRLDHVQISSAVERPRDAGLEILSGLEVVVPLPERDLGKEIEATERKISDLGAYVAREEAKLANPSFRARAPREVVEAAEHRLSDAREKTRILEAELARLRAR